MAETGNGTTTLSERMTIVLEMLEDVSRQTQPNDAVRSFSKRMRELRPSDGFLAVSIRDMPEGQYKVTRQIGFGPIGGIDPDGSNPWRDWHRLEAFSGGFIGEVIARGMPCLFEDLRVADDPVLGDLLGEMRSCLAVPAFDRGEPLNWMFTFKNAPDAFTESELEQQLMTGNLFGAMTRNLVWVQRAETLNAALRAQFEEVARVQQSLLPQRTPEIPGVTIATSYLTSEQAGGDYYDFFEMPDGKWGILVADVSGHGAGAATIMAMLHGILHSYEKMPLGPSSVIAHANERLVAAGMESSFVTAIFATYDPETRVMRYTSAGHPPAVVKDRRSGSVRFLDGAGVMPLGIMDLDEVPEAELVIEAGETVVFYTDGITEEFNASREMFGTDGLDRALRACSGQAECVVDTVHSHLFEHTTRRERADDQTLVVFQIDEGSAGCSDGRGA